MEIYSENMIEFIVITSDKYVHLMKDYPYFFNKHWDTNEIGGITILGYDQPNCELPNNFKFHSLGKQNDFGKYWTNALIPYFENVKSEYVCILIDDLFFITQVDTKKLFGVFDELCAENKIIDKYLLGSLTDNKTVNSVQFTNNSLLIHKDIDYRTTLKPSIWKTKYFRKMLKPNYNVWDFEIRNMRESKTDGSVIICHNDVNLITEFNVYEKGRFNYADYKRKEYLFSAEDNEIIKKYNV